jgi:hypothetical protein
LTAEPLSVRVIDVRHLCAGLSHGPYARRRIITRTASGGGLRSMTAAWRPSCRDGAPRTTAKLYDRTGDEITLDEVERIVI